MALIESEKKEIEETDKKTNIESKLKYQVFPDLSRRINSRNKTVSIEVSLPGVKKENISVKALPTWFNIVGSYGNIEYSANQSWGAEIIPNKTKAKYDNGLLRITAFFKDPYEDAVEVKF